MVAGQFHVMTQKTRNTLTAVPDSLAKVKAALSLVRWREDIAIAVRAWTRSRPVCL